MKIYCCKLRLLIPCGMYLLCKEKSACHSENRICIKCSNILIILLYDENSPGFDFGEFYLLIVKYKSAIA